ncbi:MAG: hypothetical protein KJ077_10895 [Anaerolineae bacterium]|nr:hypothetical protein [Anaerolineae bacterium]
MSQKKELTRIEALGRVVIHDFKVGDKVWAVVTPDGVPTRARLERCGPQFAHITSLRTGLSYTVGYHQLARTQHEAQEESWPLELSLVLKYQPNAYLVVENPWRADPFVLNVCSDRKARNELLREQKRLRPDADIDALNAVDGVAELASYTL